MKRVSTELDKLKSGMILGETIFDSSGNVLLSEGIILRKAYIDKIDHLGYQSVQIKVEASDKKIEDKSARIALGEIPDTTERDILIKATRDEAERVVKSCMEKLVSGDAVNAESINMVVLAIINEIFAREEITINLANLKSVDAYVFQHSVNVCIYSIISGIYLGFNKTRLVELGTGALLHDVGKAFLSQQILNKPDALTDEEFEHIKKHTVLGYEALKRISDITEPVACVALYHHERHDGKGYPTGKCTQSIHIYSKIVAVADVFDAITSDRVYSQKENPYIAVEYIIKSVDYHFDKEIVRVFLKAVGYYPKGLKVVLNTGEYGIITAQDRSCPVVRVLVDKQLKPIEGYYEIDLRKNPKIRILDIDPKGSQVAMNRFSDGISG